MLHVQQANALTSLWLVSVVIENNSHSRSATLSLQYGRHQCLIYKHNYNMGDWYTPDSWPVKGLLM